MRYTCNSAFKGLRTGCVVFILKDHITGWHRITDVYGAFMGLISVNDIKKCFEITKQDRKVA